MSADITIVHSSEFDNPSILPKAGWYVCALRGQECEAANGPYGTQEEAALAMTGKTTPHGMGCWLFPDLEWDGHRLHRPTVNAGRGFDETAHYRSEA